MRILLSLIAVLGFYFSALAQFSDDFSDGDFSNNPTWSGMDSLFEVNASNQLQLNDTVPLSAAYLSTESEAIENGHWEFLVQMDFNPSSANLARIYLVSDKANLLDDVFGYYVELGGTPDEVSLYRQDGSSDTKIIDGKDGRISMSFVNVRVEVFRDSSGNWELYADSTGGTDFIQEGSVFDNTYFSSSYFGVRCNYTSTRSDKFFFDDFQVSGQPYIDNVPPELDNLLLESDSTLLLTFSEGMDSTALDNNNYSVNNGIGNPANATATQADLSQIRLEFQPPFSVNGVYTLSFSNLTDPAGNPLVQNSSDFTFYKAQKGDVIINEILADNSPVVALTNDPGLEYIELYNRSSFDINLNNWTIEDNLSSGSIPNIILPADSFVVLTTSTNSDSLSFYGFSGIFVGVPSFPGLNNGGELIELKAPNSSIIDQVEYKTEWYGDPVKEEGGYSLERIDPDFECPGGINWLGSDAAEGGTPGFSNSVKSSITDNITPEIESLILAGADSLLLTFSESMDSAALNVANYIISPGNVSVANILAENELLQTFTLILNNPINIGTVYELLLNNLRDCPGNTLVGNTENFAIPEMPKANDVIISEIMPKPDPEVELPNQEYVELWNRSDKVLNLKDWAFSANNSSVTLPDRLFLPGDRIILVPKENAADFEAYGEVLSLSRLPQLTNSSGTLLLFDNTEKVIDRVLYSNTWFNSNIKKEGGWALEIIDGNNLCQGEGNWTGSKDAKGGTPGQENSVAAENPDEIAPRINHIVYEAQDSLVLFFDSPLDEAAVLSANFDLSPQDLGIGQVSWSALEPEKVRIKLQDSPRQNTIYTLTCSEITDCAGNEVDENFNSARFGIPEKPEENAVVINEILFNANTGGSDFVELYNRSNKIFDLRDLVIARAPYGSRDDYDASAICSENGFQLLPGNFVVLTPDPENIAENYTVEDERTLLEVDDMPNYLNSDGIVALLNKSLEPLDQLEYIEDWHFQLLQSVKGVSLERINYERPTQDADNWHSAAEAAGFATPGRENSNFSANFSTENNIHLEPKLFSPDGDGYKDLLQIHYQFNQPGYVANIRIFDGEGRPVRRLTNNKLLEAKGYLTWDGTTDDQTKARIGTYILMFEVFEPNGNTSKFKKSCVLGGRLD